MMPRIARGRNSTERWRPEEVVGQVKVWMIEKIKSFGANLKLQVFSQRSVLHQRSIQCVIAGTIQNVSTGIAKSALRGEDEGGGIEPAFGSSIVEIRIS